MPMFRRCGCSRVTSVAPKNTCPEVGRSKPPRMFSSVVLPDPEGPSSETNSPSRTSSDTPSSALVAPYSLVNDRIETVSNPAADLLMGPSLLHEAQPPRLGGLALRGTPPLDVEQGLLADVFRGCRELRDAV